MVKRKKVKSRLEEKGADVTEAPASKSSEAVGKAKKRKAGAADVTEAPASKSSEAVGKAGAADLTEAPASKSSEAVGKAKKQKGGAQAASSSKTAEKVVSEDFTVFVDGVPYDWSIERVTEFFSKCGPVREVRAPTWQDSGRLRGYAHVAFEGAAGKEKALKLDKAKVGKKGRYLKIEPAKKPNEGKAAAGDIEGKRRLFVKNLPYDAAEDDIAKLFSKCGKVLEIRIPHTSGRSKGFAYVEFAKAQGLRTAMELDPAPSLQGRKLLLDADVGSGPKAGFHHRPDAFQSNFGPKKKGQGKGGRGGRGGRGRGKPSLF